jgi:hypothetical protein
VRSEKRNAFNREGRKEGSQQTGMERIGPPDDRVRVSVSNAEMRVKLLNAENAENNRREREEKLLTAKGAKGNVPSTEKIFLAGGSDEKQRRSPLVADLILAGFAAGGAVVESVFPETDVELSLTEDAVLLALTTVFDLFALAAANFGLGGHSQTVALPAGCGNVPLVTEIGATGCELRATSQRLCGLTPQKTAC